MFFFSYQAVQAQEEFPLHQFWSPSREMLLGRFLPELQECFPEMKQKF